MKKFISELVNKSVKELEKDMKTAKEEIAKMMIEQKVRPQKDTNLLAKKKRNYAAILTVLNQKKQQESIKK